MPSNEIADSGEMTQSKQPTRGSSSFGVIVRMMVLALPLIVTQYATVVMQFVDAWMLGSLGSAELAAVGPSGLLVQVVISFGSGFLSGVITMVSHSFGRGDADTGISHTMEGLRFSMMFGSASLFLSPCATPIFQCFAPNEVVLHYEVSYFQICLFSVGPHLLSVTIANYFIGIQRTGIAMLGGIVGMIVNLIINYILIFGSFGIPALGFVGAAWGTVAACCIQAALMMLLFLWWKSTGHTGHTGQTRHTRHTRHILHKTDRALLRRIGYPAGIQGAIDILSWGVLLMWLIKPFGENHQAAATILMRCMQISFLPADGYAAALHTIVGESMGSKNMDIAKRQVSLALTVICIYMVGMGMLFYCYREPILRLFSPGCEEVVQIGVQAMVFVSVFQLFDAFNVTYINALHGTGDTLWPSVANALLCFSILFLGGKSVTVLFPHYASLGVWFISSAYIFSQGLTFFLRWQSGAWRRCVL